MPAVFSIALLAGALAATNPALAHPGDRDLAPRGKGRTLSDTTKVAREKADQSERLAAKKKPAKRSSQEELPELRRDTRQQPAPEPAWDTEFYVYHDLVLPTEGSVRFVAAY